MYTAIPRTILQIKGLFILNACQGPPIYVYIETRPPLPYNTDTHSKQSNPINKI